MNIERKKYSEDEEILEKDSQKPDNYFFPKEDSDQYATGQLSLDEGEEVFLDEEMEEDDLEMKINGQLDQIYDSMKYGQLNGKEMLEELNRLTDGISYNELWNMLEAYENDKKLTDKFFENFLGAWTKQKTGMTFENNKNKSEFTLKEIAALKKHRFGDFEKKIIEYNEYNQKMKNKIEDRLAIVRESIEKATIQKSKANHEIFDNAETARNATPISPTEVKYFGNGNSKFFHRFE